MAEPWATILMIIAYQYYMKSALYHDYIDAQAIAAHGFIFLRVKVCLQWNECLMDVLTTKA